MIRYPALLDGDEGAYGVVFPDIPGVAAMGDSVDEALLNAEAVLQDYAIEDGKRRLRVGKSQPLPVHPHTSRKPIGVHTVAQAFRQERPGRTDLGRGCRRVHRRRGPSARYDPHDVHHVDGPAHRGVGRITFMPGHVPQREVLQVGGFRSVLSDRLLDAPILPPKSKGDPAGCNVHGGSTVRSGGPS